MNDWHTYERRRAAFERRYTGILRRELDRQVKAFAASYKAGYADYSHFQNLPLALVLISLYGDAGGYFGRTTRNELRRAAKGQGRQPQQKRFDLRGALGFSIDFAERIADILRAVALRLAAKMGERTRADVLQILADAQTENLTLDETVQRLTERAAEINARRAETIARTEVGRAANEGKMQGARSLNVEMEKVWISARDHRTRHNPTHDPKKGDHWVLNGQRVPLDQPFNNGTHTILQPGDPMAPPAETINCRCTVVFEVKKDIHGKPVDRVYFSPPPVVV